MDQADRQREQHDEPKRRGRYRPPVNPLGTTASESVNQPPNTQGRKIHALTRRRAEEQRREIARIVRRLEAIITNHLEGARRINHPLTLEQVIAIIDALRAEAEGKNRPVAFSDGEVAFYLMDGLYEELLGEPSNIFHSTQVAEGVTHFEPLQRDFWLECLGALYQRMQRLFLG